MITFENRDCMEALKEFPDKFFELAIVDPPYGDALHAESGGGKGWFTKYNMKVNTPPHPQKTRFGGMSQKSIEGGTTRPHGVPRKEIDGQTSLITDLAADLTSTNVPFLQTPS